MRVIKYVIRIIECICLFIIIKYKKIDIKNKEIKNIHGIPYIYSKGIFCIADDIIINSKYSMNPIGGQEYCTFIVNKNAKLTIDSGARISNSTFVCWKHIYIGRNVYIGGDCKIYDTDFHSLQFDERIKKIDNDIKCKGVFIEKGAFIGSGSIILKGVTIGEKSIIGAGSVVTKSVPSDEIWGGNPAKFIRKIN